MRCDPAPTEEMASLVEALEAAPSAPPPPRLVRCRRGRVSTRTAQGTLPSPQTRLSCSVSRARGPRGTRRRRRPAGAEGVRQLVAADALLGSGGERVADAAPGQGESTAAADDDVVAGGGALRVPQGALGARGRAAESESRCAGDPNPGPGPARTTSRGRRAAAGPPARRPRPPRPSAEEESKRLADFGEAPADEIRRGPPRARSRTSRRSRAATSRTSSTSASASARGRSSSTKSSTRSTIAAAARRRPPRRRSPPPRRRSPPRPSRDGALAARAEDLADAWSLPPPPPPPPVADAASYIEAHVDDDGDYAPGFLFLCSGVTRRGPRRRLFGLPKDKMATMRRAIARGPSLSS